MKAIIRRLSQFLCCYRQATRSRTLRQNSRSRCLFLGQGNYTVLKKDHHLHRGRVKYLALFCVYFKWYCSLILSVRRGFFVGELCSQSGVTFSENQHLLYHYNRSYSLQFLINSQVAVVLKAYDIGDYYLQFCICFACFRKQMVGFCHHLLWFSTALYNNIIAPCKAIYGGQFHVFCKDN